MALTRRQKDVLDFIAGYQVENGYNPSYEEIAKGLNLASLATVHKHISTLEGKQYLKRGFNLTQSGHAAGKQYRFAVATELTQEGQIGNFARGNFMHRHAERIQA